MPFEDEKLASHNNLIFTVIVNAVRVREERAEHSLRKSPEVPYVLEQRERTKGVDGGLFGDGVESSRVPVPVRTPGVTNEAVDKRANEHTVSHN